MNQRERIESAYEAGRQDGLRESYAKRVDCCGEHCHCVERERGTSPVRGTGSPSLAPTLEQRIEGLIRDPDQDEVTIKVLAQNSGTMMRDGPPHYKVTVEGAQTFNTHRYATLIDAVAEGELLLRAK